MPKTKVTRSGHQTYSVFTTRSNDPAGSSTETVTRTNVAWNNQVTLGDGYRDWKRRIADGQSATTSLTGYKREVKVDRASIEVGLGNPKVVGPQNYQTVYWSNFGQILPLRTVVTDPDDLATNRADDLSRTKVISALTEARSAFEGGAFLGELPETVRFFKGGLRRLFNAAVGNSAYRSTGVRLKRSLSDEFDRIRRKTERGHVPDRYLYEGYLTWMWAVRPLWSDLNDGYHAIRKLHNGQRPVSSVPFREVGKDQSVNPSVLSGSSGVPPTDFTWDYRLEANVYVVYQGAMKVYHASAWSDYPRHFGLDFSGLVRGVWEATPYSWFIDYFSNAAEVIAAVSSPRFDIAWAQRTVIQERKGFYTNFSKVPFATGLQGQSPWLAFQPGNTTETRRNVARTQWVGGFVPSLTYEIPGANSWKWLNLAAFSRLKLRV